MQRVHQYTCSACNSLNPAPSHHQSKSVALPGFASTEYKHEHSPIQSHCSNLIFKC